MGGKTVETKPKSFHAVRLWLPCGRTVDGLWTGTQWMSEGHEVFPTHWAERSPTPEDIWAGARSHALTEPQLDV